MVYLILLIDIILATSANILLKKGSLVLNQFEFSSKNIGKTILTIIQNPFLLLGLLCYGLTFILWVVVLSKMKLSVAYPISVGLTVTFVSIAAFLFLRESISFLQMIGIGIIIFGIFVLLTAK